MFPTEISCTIEQASRYRVVDERIENYDDFFTFVLIADMKSLKYNLYSIIKLESGILSPFAVVKNNKPISLYAAQILYPSLNECNYGF